MRVGVGANVGTTKLVVVLVCCNCRCRCDHLVALVVTSWWLNMKCSFAVIGAFVFGIGGRCGSSLLMPFASAFFCQTGARSFVVQQTWVYG